MSIIQSQPWEIRLLVAAQEALNSQSLGFDSTETDDGMLNAAYRYCEDITRYHSRTFFVASGLLPQAKRRAARALYAFCRITDDIVDDGGANVVSELDEWRSQVMVDCPRADLPVSLAWADAQAQFNIPRGYAQQLIDGVARDLTQTRYETFDDLAEYSYGVASTVGLMAMHIIGFVGEEALPYAIRLGVALQITNILRDVGEDWRRGRLYLPQDELKAFNITEHDIERGQVTDNWREFMRFQIDRNRKLYEESLPGIAMLNSDGRFAIAAAAGLYQAILSDIEKNDYNNFSRRAHISTIGKVSRLPRIWWSSKTATIA